MSRLIRFLRERTGAAAAEFALILPGLLFLIFGALNLFLVIYASVSLQSAVQQAARYASTYIVANAGADPGATAVKAYALNRYIGPGIGASFSYATTGACSKDPTTAAANGLSVTGSGSYKIFYGAGTVTVPLSATACFPQG